MPPNLQEEQDLRQLAFAFVAAALMLGVTAGAAAQQKARAAKPTIIELIQTPGQFDTKELKLKPGHYVFKITNKDVDHEVGFWLRPQTPDGKARPLPNSDAGHLKAGQSGTTGVVELKPGKYLYSCPLNPTPHYLITVE